MKEKKTLFIIAHKNFRDEEFQEPWSILNSAGVKCDIASSKIGVCKGILGLEIKANKTVDEIDTDDYNSVVFIGGGGSKEYWDSKTAHKIARNIYKSGGIVSAICIAPITLANAGLLMGKNVTAFPSVTEEIKKAGGKVTNSKVEVDGKIITASGPEAAKEFGDTLLVHIRGASKSAGAL